MGRERALVALRWVVTAVLVALLAVGMIRLSAWQWHKHVARDAQINRVDLNRQDGVVPVASVVRGTDTVGQTEQWRSVRATGTYDPVHEVVVRLRSVSGTSGFEVLTPLRGADGTNVLVDRGLLPLGDSDAQPSVVPTAPRGAVTVTGYLRSPEAGGTAPVGGLVRRADVGAIAPSIPYPVLDGYLQASVSDPGDSASFLLLPPPSDDPGPYLSYSVQWVIFAAIAVGGLLFLALDELRGGRVRERIRAAAPAPGSAAGPPPGPPPTATSARRSAGAPGASARRRRQVRVLAGGADRGAGLPSGFFDDATDDDDTDDTGHSSRDTSRDTLGAGRDRGGTGATRPGPPAG